MATSFPREVGTGPPENEAGGILTIDLDAIVGNWRTLARHAVPAECAAVVKADAYGCGAQQVTRALAAAGCRVFFVAHLDEGRVVRQAAPEAVIYVLNGLLPGTAASYAESNLRPVLCSTEEWREWMAFSAGREWSGRAALQADTGMNRLGLDPEEAAQVAGEPGAADALALLMSHFACSEDPAHPLNAKQMADFLEIRRLFASVPASLANSSGIFLGRDAVHDLVRPGVALFGGNPTPGHTNPMQPVVRLQGRIVQRKTIEPGESVGYGAAWRAKRVTELAVVSVGYADGLFRSASGTDLRSGADVSIGGQLCPVVGRISMDLLTVDVTGVDPRLTGRGALVNILDDHVGIDGLAVAANTISYEVLTSLGRRYRRVYTTREK
jgi:alanine racemase